VKIIRYTSLTGDKFENNTFLCCSQNKRKNSTRGLLNEGNVKINTVLARGSEMINNKVVEIKTIH
jgi:hypothetical protein